MYQKHRLWKWELAGLLLIVCALLVNPLLNAVFAVRLALSLQTLASGSTEQPSSLREIKIRRRVGAQNYDALLYFPAKSPATSAIVLVPGLSELGCYHPRFIALSRLLADKGLLVITPDIREFRAFQITAEPISQILFWYTLALIAAARPEIRDKVGFAVAIGPYCNLIRCARGWFAAGPVTAAGDSYPTRFYARWIVMLSALDMIESERDRLFLRSVLENLLLQKTVPPARANLTSEGMRWYALATGRETQSDPGLSREIEQYLVSCIYPQVDPEPALATLRCPVFLIHGAYDDLIPPEESLELHRRIPHSYLLISPFLTHTHPTGKQLSWTQKVAAALDTFVFSYQLSKVIR
jgi:hypothetical protein